MQISTDRKKVIMVDDNITNLTIGKNVLKDKYDVFTAPSGEKLFGILSRAEPDLILLDVEMPDMNGFDVIKKLREGESTKHIPVIFLTAKSDVGSELEGLSLGASDYVSKPFSTPLLMKRIEHHILIEEQRRELKNYNDNLQCMVKEKTEKVLELQNAVLQTVAELVECRDGTTGGHIDRTQAYLKMLVRQMIEKDVYTPLINEWANDNFFFQSAQLHDVGKIGIPDAILSKPGKLTFEEFEEMKTHTTFGEMVINKISRYTSESSFLEHARIFALTHHEKWNGQGYPRGLSEEEIPLQGRIMALVDVYDALISERPYKKAMKEKDALEIIREGRGSHFDPKLTDLFLDAKRKNFEVLYTA